MDAATQTVSTGSGAAAAAFLARFAHSDGSGVGPAWAASLRRRAMSAFAERGFPTRHDEDWRFTPLGGITDRVWTSPPLLDVSEADVDSLAFGALVSHRIVLIDGVYSAAHSRILDTPVGVRVGSLAVALAEDQVALRTSLTQYASMDANPFVALNTAHVADGALIIIPRGVAMDHPIHIMNLSTAAAAPAVSHPRTLILASENSQVTIIESHAAVGDGPYWTNPVTEIVASGGAIVEHYKIHREGDQAQHTATTQVQLDRASIYSSQSIMLGGLFTRNDINAVLAGEGVSCTLNGVYIADGEQIVDNHTSIEHAMPKCESHELYKGILDGRARGIFNGKIYVAPDAQKTNAKQTNKTLLLSGQARIDTKPQLEIYADDVKCTHGATVGQPDEEAIFYLRSRGIGEADARAMMTYAFAADGIERVKIDEIRQELSSALFGIAGMQQRDIDIQPEEMK